MTTTTEAKDLGNSRLTVSALGPAESDAERFVRVATRRTRTAIRHIQRIGNCADRNNYAYTDAQAHELLAALEAEIEALRHKFTKRKELPEFSFTASHA